MRCTVQYTFHAHTRGGRNSQALFTADLVNMSETLHRCICSEFHPSFLKNVPLTPIRQEIWRSAAECLPCYLPCTIPNCNSGSLLSRITYGEAGQGPRLLIHIPEHVNNPRASLHQGITTGKVDDIQRTLVIPETFFVDFQRNRDIGSSGRVEGVDLEIKHRKWW